MFWWCCQTSLGDKELVSCWNDPWSTWLLWFMLTIPPVDHNQCPGNVVTVVGDWQEDRQHRMTSFGDSDIVTWYASDWAVLGGVSTSVLSCFLCSVACECCMRCGHIHHSWCTCVPGEGSNQALNRKCLFGRVKETFVLAQVIQTCDYGQGNTY